MLAAAWMAAVVLVGAAHPHLFFQTGDVAALRSAAAGTHREIASHITTLNPGEAPHAAHRHPEEELMIVKEGTLEVMLNGQPARAEAGGMIFCASNELHGIRNVGKTPATYYVVKWYPHDMPKTAAAVPAPAPVK